MHYCVLKAGGNTDRELVKMDNIAPLKTSSTNLAGIPCTSLDQGFSLTIVLFKVPNKKGLKMAEQGRRVLVHLVLNCQQTGTTKNISLGILLHTEV